MKKILLLLFLTSVALAQTGKQPLSPIQKDTVKAIISDSLDAIRTSIGSGSITLPDSTLFASDSTAQRTFSDLKYLDAVDTLSLSNRVDAKASLVITDSLAEDVANNKYYVNVKEYGAVGDGITDDTDAFTDAITYLGSVGGGTLLIPEGTFLTNIDISAYSDMHIVGVGQATILKAVTADPVITINGVGHYTVNNSVRELEINGNATSYGISVTATAPNVVNDLTVNNVRISNATRGIYINSTTVAEEVYMCKFSNIHISDVTEYGIYQTGGIYNSWTNISIDGLTGTANAIWSSGTNNSWISISTDGRIYNQGQNNVFTNVSIESIAGDADLGTNAFGSYGANTIIQGLRMTSVDGKVGYGLYLHQNNHTASNISFSVNTPEIPIGFYPGATGIISNVNTTGTHTYIDSTYDASELDNWIFYKCADLFSDNIENRIADIAGTDYVLSANTTDWDKTSSDDFVKSDTTLTLATKTNIASLASKTELGDSVDLRISTNIAGLDDVPDASIISNYIVISDEDNAGAYKASVYDLPVSEATSNTLTAKVNLTDYNTDYQALLDSIAALRRDIGEGIVVIDPQTATAYSATGGIAPHDVVITWTQAGNWDSVSVEKYVSGAWTWIDSVKTGGATTVTNSAQVSGTYYYRLITWYDSTGAVTPTFSATVIPGSELADDVVYADSFFVSTAASGNGSGDSWTNAALYSSFNEAQLTAGDVVYIDGGDGSTDKLYDGWSIEHVNGSATAPEGVTSGYITFRGARDYHTGHSATPIFRDISTTNSNALWLNTCSYVEISYVKADTGSTYRNARIFDTSYGHHIRFMHNEFVNVIAKSIKTNYTDDVRISYNTFQTGVIDNTKSDDCMNIQVCANLQIDHNYILWQNSRTSEVAAGVGDYHMDITQLNGLTGTTNIYNNYMRVDRGAATAIFIDNDWVSTGTFNIYNNIVDLTGVSDIDGANAVLEVQLDNPSTLNVYNNVLIAADVTCTINMYASAVNFKNNLVRIGTERIGLYPYLNNYTNVNFDYNRYITSNGTNYFMNASGRSANTFAGWQGYSQDLNSECANSGTYTLVDAPSTTATDYMLADTSSGVNEGTDLSSVFTTDYRDSLRVGAWDIGAFTDSSGQGVISGFGDNLITNGNFTYDVSGWGNSDATVAYVASFASRSGVCQATATGTDGVWISQTPTVATGTSYQLSFYYYIDVHTTTDEMQVYIYDSGLETSQALSIGNITTGAWTYVNVEVLTTQPGTAFLMKFIQNDSDLGITVGDRIYFDDVQLKEIL